MEQELFYPRQLTFCICIDFIWLFLNLLILLLENEVDFDALMCMSNDDIKELVPTIGLRAKLKNKLSEYRQIYNISTTGLNLPNVSELQTFALKQ